MSGSCFCDYEPAHFYAATTPKARVTHKCYECGGAILPGEQYERVVAIWERGDPLSTVCTCCRCLELRTYVQAHVPCFCLLHGDANNDAIEAADAYAHEAPGLLFGAYRRLVAIQRHASNKEEES